MGIIIIKEDFTEYPGLRHCDISDFSGEEFYHKRLNGEFFNSLNNGEKLTVVLDDTAGYASSFLDEAFGNLVYDFTLENVKNNIIIISEQEPHWKEMIEEKTYLQWENRRLKKKNPIVTSTHNPWNRIIDGKYKSTIWERPITATP